MKVRSQPFLFPFPDDCGAIPVWALEFIWVWVNTYRYIFSGMNIHLPAILGFTRYQGFDPSPYDDQLVVFAGHKNSRQR